MLSNERAVTAAGFLRPACAWLPARGLVVRTVYTHNGAAYRGSLFQATCPSLRIRSKHTPPYSPQTNGKGERFHRTMLNESAYVRVYRSQTERTAALCPCLHMYNHHRCHTAIGGLPPLSRVNILPGHYT